MGYVPPQLVINQMLYSNAIILPTIYARIAIDQTPPVSLPPNLRKHSPDRQNHTALTYREKKLSLQWLQAVQSSSIAGVYVSVSDLSLPNQQLLPTAATVALCGT